MFFIPRFQESGVFYLSIGLLLSGAGKNSTVISVFIVGVYTPVL